MVDLITVIYYLHARQKMCGIVDKGNVQLDYSRDAEIQAQLASSESDMALIETTGDIDLPDAVEGAIGVNVDRTFSYQTLSAGS